MHAEQLLQPQTTRENDSENMFQGVADHLVSDERLASFDTISITRLTSDEMVVLDTIQVYRFIFRRW